MTTAEFDVPLQCSAAVSLFLSIQIHVFLWMLFNGSLPNHMNTLLCTLLHNLSDKMSNHMLLQLKINVSLETDDDTIFVALVVLKISLAKLLRTRSEGDPE